MTVTEGKNP